LRCRSLRGLLPGKKLCRVESAALLRELEVLAELLALRDRLTRLLVKLDDLGVVVLTGKHEVFAQSILAVLLQSLELWVFLQFLHSVCIPQSVEGRLAAGKSWRDVGNHGGLAVAHEGVLEHLCKLALSEWQVCLARLIKSTDALLQGEETLVDLRTILLGLLASVDDIGATLRSRQIDEAHFGEDFATVLDEIGEDGVRTRRLCICSSRATRSALQACVNGVHDRLDLVDGYLLQIRNLHATS